MFFDKISPDNFVLTMKVFTKGTKETVVDNSLFKRYIETPLGN